jgi:membrane protease YdiL (CAAX protease family)
MTLDIMVFCAFVAYAGPYHLAWSAIFEKRKSAKIVDGSAEKRAFYRNEITGMLAPTVLVLAYLSFKGEGLGAIGLRLPSLEHGWLSIAALAALGLYSAFLAYQCFAIRAYAGKGGKIDKRIAPETLRILPRGRDERRLYATLSISAGIGEEILYRGYCIYALELLLPNLGPLFAILISAVCFGVPHVYTGPANAAKTALIGIAYAALYLGIGSIAPLMVAHALQDLSASHLKEIVREPEGIER